MEELFWQLAIPVNIGVLSTITAVYVASLRNKAELNRAILLLEQSYSKSIFDKRLEVYPELYRILSSYAKTLEYDEQTPVNLRAFRNSMDEWNSQYSVFFGSTSTKISYRFRHYLDVLLSPEHEEIKEEEWSSIRECIVHFEKSLRTEIGARSLSPVADLENADIVLTYMDDIALAAGGRPNRLKPLLTNRKKRQRLN